MERTSNADALYPDGENVVLLVGAPRSGTTWIGKIFDSHPRVLYRHEPDTVLRNDKLPYLCPREEIAAYQQEALHYLNRLMAVRTLKSAGTLPLFPKTYQGPLARMTRAGFIYALKAADALSRGQPWVRRFPIPDLVAAGKRPVIVFKSVTSRGRARLFAEAWPKCKIVLLLRHPCGQAVSMLRGISTGKFELGASFGAALATAEGRALGLTEERFAAFSPTEKCAWHWAIMNQKALNDLSSLDSGRVKILRYEDACAQPERIAKELLEFAGLDWNAQTASFVQKSTTGGDTEEFYGTTRDPLTAANKWRTVLPAPDQDRIRAIVDRFPVGEMFASLA